MLQTRLLIGACLIALAIAVLVFDQPPQFPFLFILFMLLGIGATVELLNLLSPEIRPPRVPCVIAVLAILAANWLVPIGCHTLGTSQESVLTIFVAAVLGAFVLEMALFQKPGSSVIRVAIGVWILTYLGLLPSFLAQLRWLQGPHDSSSHYGEIALALAIFIPKFCDIGAYFTGRLFGRHPMVPVLSPKKTKEGLIGGLVVAGVTALIVHRQVKLFSGGDWAALGFGVSVGLAGVLGDLAESLIKRDCGRKDASTVVPGFGGVLDVIDSIIFAAPVAYWWLNP